MNKSKLIKSKLGSTAISDVFVLIIGIMIITATTIFMINILVPFILYQKITDNSSKIYVCNRKIWKSN